MIRFIVGIFCLATLFSCASIPQTIPVSEEESLLIVEDYSKMVERQKLCPEALDSDLTVSFDSVFFDGAIKGYFQTMAPRYFRFEGVNPLGLTEIILVTDGTEFNYLAVREQKEYHGNLRAKKVQRYAPDTFIDSAHYDWFVGRLAQLEKLQLLSVGQDESGGNWLEFRDSNTHKKLKILFDAEKLLIERYLILAGDGAIDLDLKYTYPQAGQDLNSSAGIDPGCTLPQTITVKTSSNGTIRFDVTQQYSVTDVDQKTFTVTAPGDFERITVQ